LLPSLPLPSPPPPAMQRQPPPPSLLPLGAPPVIMRMMTSDDYRHVQAEAGRHSPRIRAVM
jgi:hypothetical protein